MKKLIQISLILFIIVSTVSAQNDTIGWGKNSKYNRKYNVETVVGIKGEITTVEQVVPMKGMSSGVHVKIKTGSDIVSVHLGPQWYMDKQTVQFKVGDKVEVKGSKTTVDGEEVIIAREIAKDNSVLKLRDENGIPVWSGGRRH